MDSGSHLRRPYRATLPATLLPARDLSYGTLVRVSLPASVRQIVLCADAFPLAHGLKRNGDLRRMLQIAIGPNRPLIWEMRCLYGRACATSAWLWRRANAAVVASSTQRRYCA